MASLVVQELKETLNDSESKKLDLLVKKQWQVIKFGTNFGLFLAKTNQAFETVEQAVIYQMAIDSLAGGVKKDSKTEPFTEKQDVSLKQKKDKAIETKPKKQKKIVNKVSTKPQPVKVFGGRNRVLAKSANVEPENETEPIVKCAIKKQKATKNVNERNFSSPLPTRSTTKSRQEPLETPGKKFNKIYPELRKLGWKYFNGDAFNAFFYGPPGIVKLRDRVRGVNLFTVEEVMIYVKGHLPYLLEDSEDEEDFESEEESEEEIKEPEEVVYKPEEVKQITKKKEVKIEVKSNKQNNEEKKVIKKRFNSPIKYRKSTSRSQPVYSPSKDFSVLWPKLKDLGWNYFAGTQLDPFYYGKPSLDKKVEGTRRVDLFTIDEIMVYAKDHLPHMLHKSAEIFREEYKPIDKKVKPINRKRRDSEPIPLEGPESPKDYKLKGVRTKAQKRKSIVTNLEQDFNEVKDTEKYDLLNLSNEKELGLFISNFLWPLLKSQHWCYLKASGKHSLLTTYFYAKPGTTTKTIKLNENAFYNYSGLFNYAKEHLPNLFGQAMREMNQEEEGTVSETPLKIPLCLTPVKRSEFNLDSVEDEVKVLSPMKKQKLEKNRYVVKHRMSFFSNYFWPFLQNQRGWKAIENTKLKLLPRYFFGAPTAKIEEFQDLEKTNGKLFTTREKFLEYLEALETKRNLSVEDDDLLSAFQAQKELCYTSDNFNIVELAPTKAKKNTPRR